MTLSRREMIGAIASGVVLPAIAAPRDNPRQIKYHGPTTSELRKSGFHNPLNDGVGHYVQQERPIEVNSALLEFLSATRAG
jgi:hypothetical protein